MPILFCLHGYIGSGKTTFAKELAIKENAIHFCLDEWVRRLYGWNPDETHYEELEERARSLVWSLTAQLLHNNVSVILDWGFWARKSRDKARVFAADHQADIIWYHLICDEKQALARVLERSESEKEGCVFMDEPGFYRLKKLYEAPGDDEEMMIIDTTPILAGETG